MVSKKSSTVDGVRMTSPALACAHHRWWHMLTPSLTEYVCYGRQHTYAINYGMCMPSTKCAGIRMHQWENYLSITVLAFSGRSIFFNSLSSVIIHQKRSITLGESWKYSTGQQTVFMRLAITLPKVNQFGWNLDHWAHCWGLAWADFRQPTFCCYFLVS